VKIQGDDPSRPPSHIDNRAAHRPNTPLIPVRAFQQWRFCCRPVLVTRAEAFGLQALLLAPADSAGSRGCPATKRFRSTAGVHPHPRSATRPSGEHSKGMPAGLHCSGRSLLRRRSWHPGGRFLWEERFCTQLKPAQGDSGAWVWMPNRRISRIG
jgi:hypothetical protein